MPALKNVTKETRLILKWGGFILGSLILISIFIRGWTWVNNFFHPPQPALLSVSFGKLSPPIFPNNNKQAKIIFSIDTLTGILPTFSNQVKVYKSTFQKPTLLAFANTQKKVANLGFNSQPTPISADAYQWQTQEPIAKKITVNIYTLDFNLSSSFR